MWEYFDICMNAKNRNIPILALNSKKSTLSVKTYKTIKKVVICYRLKLDSEAGEKWLSDSGLELEKVFRSMPVLKYQCHCLSVY